MAKALFRLGVVLILTAWRPQAPSSGPEPAPPPAVPAGMHILSDLTLPPADEWAQDVRWAGDKSVYLALSIEGTVELSLEPGGPPPREMIPGRSKPGGFWSSQRVAASSQYLVAAGPALAMTWRRLADPTREEALFDFIQGIDAWENRLAIVGARRGEKGEFAPEGAIAWIGTLENKLADLRPLLYDVSGPGAHNMDRCGGASLGAVRFLPGGSLVVVPGVQPGVNLYDSHGKLIRTWDSASLGIDASCGFSTDQEAHRALGPAASRNAWLNQRRTVDALLPLPQGFGLVIRRVESGHTHWTFKRLQLDGEVKSFELPIEGSSGYFHLASDARGGKIVFLLRETVFQGSGKTRPVPPRLIVAEANP